MGEKREASGNNFSSPLQLLAAERRSYFYHSFTCCGPLPPAAITLVFQRRLRFDALQASCLLSVPSFGSRGSGVSLPPLSWVSVIFFFVFTCTSSASLFRIGVRSHQRTLSGGQDSGLKRAVLRLRTNEVPTIWTGGAKMDKLGFGGPTCKLPPSCLAGPQGPAYFELACPGFGMVVVYYHCGWLDWGLFSDHFKRMKDKIGESQEAWGFFLTASCSVSQSEAVVESWYTSPSDV